MTIKEIKTVGFVGGGTMGCFNSLMAGIAGYEALIWDRSPEVRAGLPARLMELGELLVMRDFLKRVPLSDGLTRIAVVNDPVQVSAGADLLSESVFEQLDLKRQVHEEFDRLCPDRTIMTTNTSGLPLSAIESAVMRGDRFAALHSHLGSVLFDIVRGPRTSAQTVGILTRYVRSLDGVPLVLRKEKPGYLYNSMFGPILGAALMMLIEGGTAMEEIDRAWMTGQGAGIGPFGMMDAIGLNVILDGAMSNLSDPFKAEGSRKTIQLIRPMVERGDLGMKTGRGFYRYPDPAFAQPGFFAGCVFPEALYDTLLTALAVNALLLVLDGYATVHDVDRAWMIAQHAEMGPLAMLDAKGLDGFADFFNTLPIINLPVQEDRQRIRDFLHSYIDQGCLGVKSGRGFYCYPDPAYKRAGFLFGDETRDIA